MTPEDQLKPQDTIDLDSAVEQLRQKFKVPRVLVDRMVNQESGGNTKAVSPVGARGRFQVMPGTIDQISRETGKKLDNNNPLDNAYAGLYLLNQNYNKFKQGAPSERGAWMRAVAAYHAGAGNVQKDLQSGGAGIPDVGDGLINTQDHVYNIFNGTKSEDFGDAPQIQSGMRGMKSQGQSPGGIAGIVQREMSRQPRTRPKKSIPSQQGIEVGGKVGPQSEAEQTRGGLRGLAEMAGAPTQLLPNQVQDWINEPVAAGAGQLMGLGAGIARQLPTDPFQKNQVLQDTASALQKGGQQIQGQVQAAQADRGRISRGAQNLVAGAIGSAPAMILTSLGVPAPVAFGLQSELEASGRDADFKDIVKDTAKGATIGALFELPLPAKAELLTALQARLLRAGIVGAGTATITGSPQESIITAAFGGLGGKGKEEARAAEVVPENPYGVRTGAAEDAVRHVDLQRRLDDGTFGKETKAETTARQAQVAATEAPQVEPAQAHEPMKPAISAAEPPLEAASTQSPDKSAATATTLKPSRLAQGVEAKAIEANLTQAFEGLPEYQTVNVKDQAQRATELLDSNPEQARRIAMGQEHPPSGLIPESVFTAVENRALQNGDVDTLRALATESTRSMEATGMGQRIRMLAERNPNSAVAAIQKVQAAREARVSPKKLKQVQNQVKTEIQAEMKPPKPKDWDSFLQTIICK